MTDIPLLLDVKIQNACIATGDANRDTNKIVLEITNHSEKSVEFSGVGNHGDLTLSCSIGTGAEDLMKNSNPTIDAPVDWNHEPYKKVSRQAVWTFRLSNKSKVFQPGESKTICLHHFESCAAQGQANVTIGVIISGYEKFERILEVEKKADEFQLLYFKADPPYITTEKDGQAFTLKWNTIKAGKVVLYKNNSELKTFTAGLAGYENGKEFVCRENAPDLNGTVYKLVATDKADQAQRRESKVTVSVLEPGWHPMSSFSCYGCPAVLFNRDKVDLYGIFIKDKKACLYSSKYPCSAWDLKNETVPDKMETSPGVYFDNKLCLVGGSSVDPDNCSNQIWTYDCEKAQWKEYKQSGKWPARMGHACIVFKKKLWIMGGMDAAGNALNDVHSLDFDGNRQTHADPPWDPRCMFAATVFKDKIWIYGGCAEPFRDPLGDMWTSVDGEKWMQYKDLPKLDDGSIYKPISCALQVVNGELNLMGSFREHGSVVHSLLVLSESQKTWSKRVVANPWHGQKQNTHSLSAVSFKGLVFVHSLNYEIDQKRTYLVLYVPRQE
ncbi:MAG: hypothetical protein LWX55_04120 [Deltaproteobacteria bacterium]|jgi:hypothetical protein|nr:hypothetical protein [Deltaproteobacteria bacterium]